MSAQENVNVVKHVLDEIDRGNFAIVDEHPGLEEVRTTFMQVRQMIPDMRRTVALQFADGDWVATRIIITGTMSEHSPIGAGSRLEYEVLMLHQVQDGRIVKQYSQAAWMDMLRQSGVQIPGMG